MILIAVISSRSKISGRLTKLFTGSYAYHVGFVDTERTKFYDMNLLFRRRTWPHYPAADVTLYYCPVAVTADDLEWWLDHDDDWYGVLDYLSFGLKKLLPGIRTSFKGAICSEKVWQILQFKGWAQEFEFVPSPADFEKILQPLIAPSEGRKEQ